MTKLKKAIKKIVFYYYKDDKLVTEQTVPWFKKNFSKDVRELWDMLEEPNEEMTESDLIKKLEKLETVINKFKSDIYEFQHYS